MYIRSTIPLCCACIEPTCNRSIQLDLNDDTATVVANIEGLQCSVDEGELISCESLV